MGVARSVGAVLGWLSVTVACLLVGAQAHARESISAGGAVETGGSVRLAAGALSAESAQGGPGAPEKPALLAELFQDHAVLQRDKSIAVWGRAASGEAVTISLAATSVRARADSSGRWSAVLPAMSAGGPFVLTAQGESGARQSANDVLIGDVFLCSGQSNMELPVERTGDARNEIAGSANSTIRMLTIVHASSPTPLASLGKPVSWELAAPATVPDWSAACFYFARELQKTIHVSIGLVHTSWGGSNIRPWISASGFRALGGYGPDLDIVAVYAKDPAAAQGQFAGLWETWWRSKTGDRAGTEPWSASVSRRPRTPAGAAFTSPKAGPLSSAAVTSAALTSATLTSSALTSNADDWQPAPPGLGDWRYWGVGVLRSFTGLIWYRTRITLTAAEAKSVVGIDLGAINQIDETWVNGRALGNTFGYGTERSYSIAPGVLHAGENDLVVNVLSTYGGGGLLAGGATRALRLAGGGSIPLDGPWQYRVVPAAVGYPPRAPWEAIGGVTTLYNAMIAPLGAYGFRGAVWYQGESNTGEAGTYRALLAALMADWRRQFGPDLPFLIVQLPNYGAAPWAPGQESDWAALREAQRAAVENDAHAGLAVTIDIGEPRNLHPTNKQDVGSRLARAARHVIYGETIPPSGPTARGASWRASQIAVEFGDIESGLVAYSNERPIGFELCGDAPRSCRFAESSIEGSRVVLTVPRDGPPPTRVRYCWADSPVCTLFDRSGLPAGPFELPIRAGAGH
jgi:sialate O-acetylesterase